MCHYVVQTGFDLKIYLLQLPEFWGHSIALPYWVLNCILCVRVFVPHICMYLTYSMPSEVRKRCQVLWDGSYRQLWVTLWGIGNQTQVLWKSIQFCSPSLSLSVSPEMKSQYVAQNSFECLGSIDLLALSFQDYLSDRLMWSYFKCVQDARVITLHFVPTLRERTMV